MCSTQIKSRDVPRTRRLNNPARSRPLWSFKQDGKCRDTEDAQPHGPEQPQIKPISAASLIFVLFYWHSPFISSDAEFGRK
jgi:hypothetical protein